MKKKDVLSLGLWSIIGIGVGILTGYLRAFNPMSFWSFSDIAGRYGFWIFTVSLIAHLSNNKRNAGVHSFLYMIFMCIAYYGYLYLTKGFLYKKQFLLWGIFSVVASGYAVLIRIARDNQRKRDIAICVIPLTLLGIELMNMIYLFIQWHTSFLQVLIDFVGVITLGYLFSKGKQKICDCACCAFSFLLCNLLILNKERSDKQSNDSNRIHLVNYL